MAVFTDVARLSGRVFGEEILVTILVDASRFQVLKCAIGGGFSACLIVANLRVEASCWLGDIPPRIVLANKSGLFPLAHDLEWISGGLGLLLVVEIALAVDS